MTWAQFYLAASILMGAGCSDFIGQSVVLFLNKVPPRRFLLCLCTGTLLFQLSALGWVVSLWVLGRLFDLDLGLGRCFWLTALSHTPLLAGWMVLLPHAGRFLFHWLRGWVFLNLVVAVGLATQAPLLLVVGACLPGWLLHFSLTHLELLRLERPQARLWRLLTGTRLEQ